jgi:hypothetical protein
VTVINCIKQKTAVHILTDGATWLFNGSFFNGPPAVKAWPLPHLSAVVAARGPIGSPTVLASFFGSSGCRSYDELKRAAVTIVREAMTYESYSHAFAGPFGSKIEIVIAGFSETVGPDAFVVSVAEDRTLTANDCGPILMAPGDHAIQAEALASLPGGVKSADDMDPERDGISMMEAQRAAFGLTGAPSGMTTCGAFAQLSTISATSIISRIIKRWPYEIGQEAA